MTYNLLINLKRIWRSRYFAVCLQSIAWALSGVCFVYMCKKINPTELWEAAKSFNLLYMLFGLAALSASYSIRIYRWAILLRAGGANLPSAATCSAAFMGAVALNNVLPLRAGDVMRAVVFPKSLGVLKITATTSIVLERLLDLLTLLLFLSIGLVFSPLSVFPLWIKKSLITLILIGGGTMGGLFLFSASASSFFEKNAEWAAKNHYLFIVPVFLKVQAFLRTMSEMVRWQTISSLFFISLFVWLGEIGFYWFFLLGSGLSVSLGSAMIVMAMTTLSTLMPASPGYIGTFHLAAYTGAILLGATSTIATEFAFFTHSFLWFSTTLVGGLAILSTPRLFYKSHQTGSYASSI